MFSNLYCRSLFSTFFVLYLVACSEDVGSVDPVAEVGDAVLSRATLMSAIPVTSSAADRAVYADDYVRSWVYRQVLLQKAEQYLTSETEDIDAQVDEYRSSLIIETYQNKLVEQKFVSNVKQSDVENYYERMKQNFILREPIIKGMYAVLPIQGRELKDFLKLLTRMDEESSLKVEEYLFNHTKQYKTFFDSWSSYASVRKFFPQEALPDDPRTAANSPYMIFEKDGQSFILKVTSAINAGGQAPLDFVKGDITNILISQQKLEFLSSANRELYDQAMKAGRIKFHEVND
ncbi:MAG: hypothetical protein ACI35Q_07815 [Marinilabiliaceae bacterium]